MNPEDSLWDSWKRLHHQVVGVGRETKRRFESLSEQETLIDGDILYLKWDQRGICQTVILDTENKVARVESVANWFYPQVQPIGLKTIKKSKNILLLIIQSKDLL